MTTYVNILTRGRGTLALDCARSAIEMANGEVIPYIYIDADEDVLNKLRAEVPHIGMSVVYLPERCYFVRATYLAYNFINGLGADYFVCSNDDAVFKMKGWDTYVKQQLHERYRDGLGILELAGPELCTHFASRTKFINESLGGEIACLEYTHYCSDTELRERARALNRYGYCPAPDGTNIIEHQVREDELRANLTRFWYPIDQQVYKRRWKPHWKREVWQ